MVGAYQPVKPSQSVCVADEWQKSIAEIGARQSITGCLLTSKFFFNARRIFYYLLFRITGEAVPRR